MIRDNSEKLMFILPLVILSVFMIGYLPVFEKLLVRWEAGDNSYCYLIVPLFLYLLYDIREKRKEKREKSTDKTSEIRSQKSEGRGFAFGEFSWNIWGLLPVILSVLLIIVGELGSVETLLYTGLWGCISGLFIMLYGQRVRQLIFPFLILLFMVPLPPFINRILTFNLKLAASKLSVAMLRFTGVVVSRDGNIIDLGISQLQVVDACSGLRYLMPMILTALLVGYFFIGAKPNGEDRFIGAKPNDEDRFIGAKPNSEDRFIGAKPNGEDRFNKKLWQKIVLVLMVVPLSIFVNAIRIWITGMLTVKGYEKFAQSFFHDFSGWLIYMIAGAVLVAAALS